MATLTIPNTFSNGATIVASEHNANFTAVKTFCEALSAGTNIDDGSITSSKLANNAVIEARIASGQISTRTLAASLTLTTPNIGVATGTSLNTSGPVVGHKTVFQSNVPVTLELIHDGNIIEMANGGFIYIPLNSSVPFPVGTEITVISTGNSQVTASAVVGVSYNSANGFKTRAPYSVMTLTKRATNAWIISGDTAI